MLDELFSQATTNCSNYLLTPISILHGKSNEYWLNIAAPHFLLHPHQFVTSLPVYILTTGWKVRDRIPVGTRFFRPSKHPASCKTSTGSFPGVKCGRGLLLTTHPLLVPRSWKSRAIPLPTLWATPGL